MIASSRLAPETIIERERALFRERSPRSSQLAERTQSHWLSGVPMHWMADWGTPFPLFVSKANGVTLTDADAHLYLDFCLGDTGAMYGHSPEPIAAAITTQSRQGLTCMLPSESVASVGAALAARFQLPFWQVTQTATDANRAALRWARAITGRSKILVFQGCYHGTVEETMVRLRGGRTVPREGAIGPAFDASNAAVAIEFNDIDALERALESGEIAAVIAEPVMTNIGMVLPQAGFLDHVRERTRAHDVLLILDETHTLSSGPGGYAASLAWQPDFWVCGKAIAGGLPAAVFGFSNEIEARMRAVLAHREAGHSGMGTTLAANPLVFAALSAALKHLHTEVTHAAMQNGAVRLEQGLKTLFAAQGLDWHVSRVGARLEFGFGPAPRNGSEAEAQDRPALGDALRLWLVNRGILMTPFHQMLLAAPMLAPEAIDALGAAVDGFLEETCG
ncbi:MAG: transaminase [Steroidobacteraceae bacterium]